MTSRLEKGVRPLASPFICNATMAPSTRKWVDIFKKYKLMQFFFRK